MGSDFGHRLIENISHTALRAFCLIIFLWEQSCVTYMYIINIILETDWFSYLCMHTFMCINSYFLQDDMLRDYSIQMYATINQ